MKIDNEIIFYLYLFSEVVDDLLTRYDSNGDGLLVYPEFMISFKENHEKLNG